jgi:hypothetical protein
LTALTGLGDAELAIALRALQEAGLARGTNDVD